MKVTRYICHTSRTIKVLKFLFVLKIVTKFRFWKFRVYFRTFRFEILSIPKLRVRRWRVSQAVGIFRYSWSNDISGNSGFYIHRFVYSGLSLVVCPTQLTFFDDFVVTTTKVRSMKQTQLSWRFKSLEFSKSWISKKGKGISATMNIRHRLMVKHNFPVQHFWQIQSKFMTNSNISVISPFQLQIKTGNVRHVFICGTIIYNAEICFGSSPI